MIRNRLIRYAIVMVIGVCVALYWLMHADRPAANPPTPMISSAVGEALNTCQGIADKSVAHMTAMVEFQKLEIAGRRIRVLQNCMNDQGYEENSAWAAYAQPVSVQNAERLHVSANEAYEQLRRTSMEQLSGASAAPVYWQAKVAAP